MTNYHQLLQSIVEGAIPALKQLDQKSFERKESPERWSQKEIIGHLIDSAYNNHQRFLRAVDQDHLMFDGYDQVAWVKLNRYQERPAAEIIKSWKAVNVHLAALIQSLPADLLQRETTEHNFHQIGMNRPEKGSPSSLAYLVWDYIFHLEHHLAQIIPNYEKQLGPYS